MAPELTPKQQKFVEEYLVDLNATQAAIRAGYSPRTANEQGARLLANVSVKAAIAEGQKTISERTQITQDMVLKRWWSIATAEINEVIQFRRVCCRYCYGINHAYQWKDAAEFQSKLAAAAADEKTTDESLPNDEGGYGFNPTLDPHPSCPDCHGEGHGELYALDTRKLTGSARLLYDGVKITDRGGFEVKTLDRAKALENIARHLGMFTDKAEISGPNGGPIQTAGVVATMTADLQGKSLDELTRLFTEKMKG